jgi:predicted DsbA family dithiol-disulfide isomerase
VGTVVNLDSLRQPRTRPAGRRVQVFVDIGCPFSYLAAERIQRAFSRVAWKLASNASIDRRDPAADPTRRERIVAAAEDRALELHLPIQWPEDFPRETPAAMRAASLAIERGRGGQFILAAGRLAFAGGFDLEDPEILAEAAAAAQLDLDDCLRAARDERRDDAIEATSLRLLAAGAERLPAVRVDRTLLSGERAISAYLAAGAPRESVASS